MDYDELLALARRRQSFRDFAERPVPGELVDKVLAAAVEAPTSCNHQLNRFVVVDDPEIRQAIHRRAGAPVTVARAPVSIVLGFRMGWNHNKLSVAQSLGMAAQNMLLAATALGLRAVVQAGIGDTDVIREILGMGDGYFVASILSLGWSDEVAPRPPRLPVEAVASRNRFEEPAYLRYPRRRRRTAFQDYSNASSPDGVWDPDRWPLEALGCFRGLAVWHTSPAVDVHRPRRLRAEYDAEIEFFAAHLRVGDRMLEVLPFSGAYGARLRSFVGDLGWQTFELSPHHAPFVTRRCELEGVEPPDAQHSSVDLGVDLGERWPRIVLPGALNHLPVGSGLPGFLDRHLADDGLVLATVRNSWSFQSLAYLAQRRGQVWNFGPYVPRSPRAVRRWLAPTFAVRGSHGLSLTPGRPGAAHRGPLAGLCRTYCCIASRA